MAFSLVIVASSHFVDREMVGRHRFPVLPAVSALYRRGYAGVVTAEFFEDLLDLAIFSR
jgi:sugar phosphate isomerase/epimerase